MARDTTTYGHFCMLARTLERVGDRWTLLVVRDLATGPRRFTDLADRLGGITPKTLTQRLRDLEADGLVVADRVAGRREVWYRLTPAGEALRPALDELLVWGLHHAVGPPEPGQPAHPEHLLWALRVQLDREHVRPGPTRWSFRLAEGDVYTLAYDGDDWRLEQGDGDVPADVVIFATRADLTRFLTTPAEQRSPATQAVDVTGSKAAVRTFLDAVAVFPFGRSSGSAPSASRTRTRKTRT